MKSITIKNLLIICLMLVFALMALTSENLINSKLYAAIAIILGALASHALSFKNLINNERNN